MLYCPNNHSLTCTDKACLTGCDDKRKCESKNTATEYKRWEEIQHTFLLNKNKGQFTYQVELGFLPTSEPQLQHTEQISICLNISKILNTGTIPLKPEL